MKSRWRAIFSRLSAPLRRIGSRGRKAASAHPSRALVMVGVLLGVTAFTWSLTHSTPTAPAVSTASAGPAVTYAGTWDLLDLTRHLESGDVLVISSFQDSSKTTLPARPGPAEPAPGLDLSRMRCISRPGTRNGDCTMRGCLGSCRM